MGLLDKTRMIERLQFFDGMRLFGDDLQGLEAFNREMRELHNRSLHQPGIGNGFAVYGKRGDREVTIGPGYAIDRDGHEIVLMQERKEPVPPVAGDPRDGSPVVYDLVISYPADELLEEVETRAGICDSRGVTRLREEPVFCWVKYRRLENSNQYVAEDTGLGTEIENGTRLVLARVRVQNCQLKEDISLAERRNARPDSTPLIACNAFTPKPWEPYWLLDRDDLIQLLAGAFASLILERQIPLETAPPIPEGPAARRARPARAGARSLFTTELGIAVSPLLFAPVVLPLGIQTPVSTNLGGVRDVPSYFTRISGSRIVGLDLVAAAKHLGLIDPELLDRETQQQLEKFPPIRVFMEGLPTVVDPKTSVFTFQAPMMVQLLQSLIELSRLRRLLDDHVLAQVQKHPLYLKLVECAALKDKEAAFKTCLEEAAEMALQIIEDLFIQIVVPDDWQIIWMGIEE